ncbi:diacylglycerol/lipid kinase family protein [Leucobacter sp. M11]|uniref:diacylglycerol/lipid kinase family protein n=1 Tax=Leucobacter sp. M11 TaxID=2993565 RepID=UPI002D7EA38B|nr:diacylglycerol kinase family protein [Leucobacter sp. M11]MEB4616562.1 diacylglycerol kinase family protein [Leucobacter sp. M11]
MSPAEPLPAPGRRALLIVNPSAGRGRAAKQQAPVAAALRAAGYAVTEHRSTNLSHATRLAAAEPPESTVFALGGDGLIGAAANGVIASGAILVPLGGGRGNDTVRRFGLPVDPVEGAQRLAELRETRIDVGRILAEADPALGRPEDRVFLGVCNVGFDGLANELGNATRFNLGPLTYLYGGALALMRFGNTRFAVTVDGSARAFRGWFVAVGNHGQYGGGITISPNSRVNSGHLDVATLEGGSVVRVARTFLLAFRGRHGAVPGFRSVPARTVTIAPAAPGSGPELNVYADGERIGPLPVRVETVPAALRVLIHPDAPSLAGGRGAA